MEDGLGKDPNMIADRKVARALKIRLVDMLDPVINRPAHCVLKYTELNEGRVGHRYNRKKDRYRYSPMMDASLYQFVIILLTYSSVYSSAMFI